MDNRSFWNDRYRTSPGLGSGPGSRGWVRLYKRDVVIQTAAAFRAESILDIGCGDLCWLNQEIISLYSYTGLDISEQATEMARQKYSKAEFFTHDIINNPWNPKADLTVCFDVLIHQIAKRDFDAALDHILASTRNVALVSYLTPPSDTGSTNAMPDFDKAPPEWRAEEQAFNEILAAVPTDLPRASTAFHGTLPDAVKLIAPRVECIAIGQHRRQTIYKITL